MSRFLNPSSVSVLATLLLTCHLAYAQENAGLEDLDKATDLKLDATSLRDLDQVVKLCESALEKGLDEDSTQFAKQLMVGTLLESAQRISQPILAGGAPDPRWPFMRQQALKRIERVVELEPESGTALLLQAQLNVLPDGDREAAKAAVEKAQKIFENNPQELSKCYMILGGLSKEEDKRLEYLTKAIELNGTNTDALRARGLIYMLTDKPEMAIEDFRALIAIDPTDTMAQQAIAETLTNAQKFDEAIAAIEQAIEANPKAAENYMLRARVHLMQEKTEHAIVDLTEALEIKPRDIQALLMRGELNLQVDNLDDAMRDVELALVVRPGLIQAILLRSLIFAGQGKYDSAANDMELLVQNDPQNTQWKLQLAMMYYGGERPNKAIEVYTRVLKDEPDNFFAQRGKADAMLITGDHQGAIDSYNKCLEQQPEDDHILNNLSWVLGTSPKDDLRDGERAVELGLKACEVTEYKEPHILSTLAAAYAETGDFENAKKWSSKAVELAEDGEQKENLTKELESYEAGKAWRELQEDEDKAPNQGGGTIDL
ncbi:MAG: tetratricopeptide repeat protein [Planctomycetota bacterium]|nr:tetratricopeptide repeat protein [Planctomycetota bacterium]